MAVRRRIDKRRSVVPDAVFRAFLEEEVAISEPGMVEFVYLNGGGCPERWWEQCRDAVLAEWISVHPGTRPLWWWRVDAISQRRRTGGKGTPLHEVIACAEPYFERGLPKYWTTGEHEAHAKWAPDPRDPPQFESEAAYLRRLALLLPGEARRLRADDYADVVVRL